MNKEIIVYVLLIFLVVTSFYVKSLPYFRNGYAFAEGVGIQYTLYSAALSHPNKWYLGDPPPTAQPPVLMHVANFASKFLGEINSMYLVTSFFISLGVLGIFFFVREFTKSSTLSLLAAGTFVFFPADVIPFVKMHWVFTASVYIAILVIFLAYKFLQKSWQFWILAGLLIGASFLVHPIPVAMIVLPTIFVHQLFREKWRAIKKTSVVFAVFLFVSAVWLATIPQRWIENLLFTREEAVAEGGTFHTAVLIHGWAAWTIPLLIFIFPISCLCRSGRKIKFDFQTKAYFLFWIFAVFSVFNFLSNFVDINGFWSLRYIFVYPQFAVITFAILLHRAVRNLKLPYSLTYIYMVIFMLLGSYYTSDLWQLLFTEPSFVIDKEKEVALSWLEKSTPENSKILFYNPSNETNANIRVQYGFDFWRYFSWRQNAEIGHAEMQSLQEKNSFENWDYVAVADTTVTDEETLSFIRGKGYQTVYESDRILILSKNF